MPFRIDAITAGEILDSRGFRAGAAATAFAGITADVLRAGPVIRWDSRVSGRVVAGRRRSWLAPARAVTLLGSTPIGYGVLGAVLAVRRRPDAAATAAGVYVARLLLSERIDRARPPESAWRTRASGGSFPSRHTTTAAVSARLIVDTLAADHPWARRLAFWVAAGVGTSRVVLGVHWPADVVAGWLLAEAAADALDAAAGRRAELGERVGLAWATRIPAPATTPPRARHRSRRQRCARTGPRRNWSEVARRLPA